jgi:hypothetical protein
MRSCTFPSDTGDKSLDVECREQRRDVAVFTILCTELRFPCFADAYIFGIDLGGSFITAVMHLNEYIYGV